MEALILDADALVADRLAKGLDRFDEKHFGRYVIANAPSRSHAELVGRLLVWLQARGLYTIVGINVGDAKNFRIPDVNAWAKPPTGEDFFSGESAPDLVVEVLSPSNTRAEMADRERHYLEHDVKVYVEVDLAGAVIYASAETDLVQDLHLGLS